MIPPVARRFIAGKDSEAALEHVDELNDRGVSGILNHLGEHQDDRSEADSDVREYADLVESIGEEGFDASVSVKPTQIGLDVNEDAFRGGLQRILEAADDHGVFVWMDMEDTTTTDATLDAFRDFARPSLGVCLQANLRRTPDDLRSVADHPGKVRLVKGAYDEPLGVAHKGEGVDEAYRDCLDIAFDGFVPTVALGTHDLSMIGHARQLVEERGGEFEVQMLMGVREELQHELTEDPDVARMAQYVPYGSSWMSYFYRRLRENRRAWRLAAHAVVGR